MILSGDKLTFDTKTDEVSLVDITHDYMLVCVDTDEGVYRDIPILKTLVTSYTNYDDNTTITVDSNIIKSSTPNIKGVYSFTGVNKTLITDLLVDQDTTIGYPTDYTYSSVDQMMVIIMKNNVSQSLFFNDSATFLIPKSSTQTISDSPVKLTKTKDGIVVDMLDNTTNFYIRLAVAI